MDSRWLAAGFTRDEVKKFRSTLNELRRVLEANFVKKEAVRDYSPGWEQKQIAVNEYNAVMQDVLNLITIEKEDDVI